MDNREIEDKPKPVCQECGKPVNKPVTGNADREVQYLICDDCIRKTIENS